MQILGNVDPGVSAPQSAPTSLSAIPTNTNVAISFTAPTNDGGSPITNYEYSFNNSTWTALSPADAVSPVTVSGLTQNTSYTVYLRGVNIVSSGPGSTGVTFTTAGVPTGTATISSVTVGTTTATVNFSVGAGGGAITGYDLYVTNQTNSWNNTTGSPISVAGLTANSYYVFYVRAKNAYGVGPQSAGAGATTNPVFMVASGGTTQDVTAGSYTYRVHTFTGSSTFTVSTVGSFGTVEYLVVAGGGGGGTNPGGGGGAGGFRTNVAGQTSGRSSSTEAAMTLTATSYGVSVGGGGTRGNSLPVVAAGNGGASSFNGISCSGGGSGSHYWTNAAGNGGSGGGGSNFARGLGTAGQGGDGGSASSYLCGGGGGASGNGGTGTGGNGLSNTIRGSAGTITIAGGGGGGNYYAAPGSGGSGGGGNGEGYSGRAGNGSQYGAGGGGGFVNAGYSDRGGGTGAQGVVYIRYRIA